LSDANLLVRAQRGASASRKWNVAERRVIPLKRANDPEDIAAMVVPGSPGARNITGQSFNVDGGLIPD
jgi:NAD(P)-dependent dehydrogenase (short-subunit alcohol dehydrogenase family)